MTLVNLRRARKAKVCARAEAQATENRLRFGASKAERKRIAASKEIERRRLDAQRRDTDGRDEP